MYAEYTKYVPKKKLKINNRKISRESPNIGVLNDILPNSPLIKKKWREILKVFWAECKWKHQNVCGADK